MAQMQRIMVFNRLDEYVLDIDPTRVLCAEVTEEVNGEHALTLTTLQELAKTDRIVLQDNLGTWHEFVVLGIEEEHAMGGNEVAREYYCVWSLEYDLTGTYINDQFGCGVVPGHASVPHPARDGLTCALAGTRRWQIGTITVGTQSSASFYRMTGFDGLKKVVERWGGEIQATIEVSQTGVTARRVDLLEQVGSATATRRFDYGEDLTSIKRIVHDEIWPCRIVPLGRSQETETGGYTRRPGIADANGGIEWLQDDTVADLVKVPDGNGGWEYPTAIIKNDTYEDPADIKAWGLDHITEYTRPRVTYKAEVAQFEEAGMSAHGVALGDKIAVVDRTFCEGGLRIEVRVVKMKQDLLDPAGTTLVIGNAQQTLSSQLAELAEQLGTVSEQASGTSDWQAGSAYVSALIGRLNETINATGGYWYMIPGEGTRTYDMPVSDPSVGAEANQVVEVKGGTIRIANSKDGSGEWEWKSVFTSGHIASELIDAVTIRSGFIRNYQGNSYWDLDTSTFLFGYDFTPIISETSIEVNAKRVNGSAHSKLPSAGNYAVAFAAAAEIDQNWKAGLTRGGNSSDFFIEPTKVVRLSSGSVRYVAIGATDDTTYNAYTAFRYVKKGAASSDPLPSDAPFTATDVRVYLLPDEGDGVMRFEASSTDDSVKTKVLAGLASVSMDDLESKITPGEFTVLLGDDESGLTHGKVSVEKDGRTAEMEPGLLSLGDSELSAEIDLTPTYGVYYDKDGKTIAIGNRSSYYDRKGPMFTLDKTNVPNELPGKLESKGVGVISETTWTNVLTIEGTFSVSSVYAVRWGPVAVVRAVLSTPSISASSTSGTPQTKVCTLNSTRWTPSSFVIATGSLGTTGSSKPITYVVDQSSVTSSGVTLYLPKDKTQTTDITSGTRLTLNAIYLLRSWQ